MGAPQQDEVSGSPDDGGEGAVEGLPGGRDPRGRLGGSTGKRGVRELRVWAVTMDDGFDPRQM